MARAREFNRLPEPETSTATVAVQEPAKGPRLSDWSPQQEVDHLTAKGWRPSGDPTWPGCLWYDPTKPEKASERREVVQTVTDTERRTIQREQVVCDPPAWPLSREEAMAVQRERDLGK